MSKANIIESGIAEATIRPARRFPRNMSRVAITSKAPKIKVVLHEGLYFGDQFRALIDWEGRTPCRQRLGRLLQLSRQTFCDISGILAVIMKPRPNTASPVRYNSCAITEVMADSAMDDPPISPTISGCLRLWSRRRFLSEECPRPRRFRALWSSPAPTPAARDIAKIFPDRLDNVGNRQIMTGDSIRIKNRIKYCFRDRPQPLTSATPGTANSWELMIQFWRSGSGDIVVVIYDDIMKPSPRPVDTGPSWGGAIPSGSSAAIKRSLTCWRAR